MKFGVREICDVTFKTTANGQRVGNKTFAKAGMPAFMIDTAKTSSLEQATSTVYAQGGKGNNRIIAWEGEKTMTFTVEDALISPMGLAVLSGAGLINPTAENYAHVHVTLDAQVVGGKATVSVADLREETGLHEAESFRVCTSVPVYATVLDGSGAGIEFVDGIEIESTTASAAGFVDVTDTVAFKIEGHENDIVKLDFYLLMASGVTEVEIKPQDFGGYFYVEAQTLFRREDTGKDMAAEIILPKVKVQSGFTFTMDAFPGYTMFDKTKKVMCVMQIIGDDKAGENENSTAHSHSKNQ